MAQLSVIKKEFLHKRIGFGKGADPLSRRNDIDDLAIIAHESKDPSLLQLFEKLPGLDELKKAKTDAKLKAAKALVKPKQ